MCIDGNDMKDLYAGRLCNATGNINAMKSSSLVSVWFFLPMLLQAHSLCHLLGTSSLLVWGSTVVRDPWAFLEFSWDPDLISK
jgi:hypothetical protein